MAETSKFLFETSFEARQNERARRSDGRPMPTHTEAELEAARSESFAAGHAAGSAEARGEIEAAVAQALTTIARSIASLGATHKTALQQISSDSAVLARAVGTKLASALIARHPLGEIEMLVRRCLSELHDEPRIVVRASETAVAAMKDRVVEVTQSCGFPGQIVLLPDDAMAGADCRVEWADGGVERNSEALSRRLDAAIQRFLDGEKTA